MIEEENGFLILKLNSSLYEKESVNEAFVELKKQAEALFEDGEYFVIKIKKSEGSKEIGYEFLNYVIRLMKSKGVV